MRQPALAALVFAVGWTTALTGCTPKINTTSTAALVASVAKIKMTLSHKEREVFDRAFLTVTLRDVSDADLLDLAKHADAIIPDAKAAIDGKTAEEIIALAAQIDKQRKVSN